MPAEVPGRLSDCRMMYRRKYRPGSVLRNTDKTLFYFLSSRGGERRTVSGVPFRAGCNTSTYEYYIDFAAAFGVEYVIMDEGWSKHLDVMEIRPETDVLHLVKYAEERGVGIILWCAWPQLVGRQDDVFSKYAKIGVKGFKIDFMNRDDQVVERYLEETARAAAK